MASTSVGVGSRCTSDPATCTKEGSKPVELVERGPTADEAAPSGAVFVSTPKSRHKAHLQMFALCWTLYLDGWNDGTTVVSLIFVCNCIGFLIAALINVALTDRLGFGTVMVIGASAQVIGYVLEAPAPPFPVFVLGYAINGFGIALQDASANGFVASLKDNQATKMGIMHAVYGMGALSSPLVATQFATLPRWSFAYLTSLGVALLNLTLLIVVFRFKTQDECLAEIGQAPSTERTEVTNEKGNKYKQIFRLRAVHILACFAFFYAGMEVTIGGWIVTYVIDLRGGGPSSGYISSGFYGGLTLGRVGLLWVNKTIGERRVIFLYAFLVIGLVLVIWLVPSLIGGAVAISFVGMLIGPFFPLAMNQSSRILPPRLLTGSISWISGMAMAGSALMPFLTGALASREGIKSLPPLAFTLVQDGLTSDTFAVVT
ncbi:Bypass of stop codon protein 6 [Grifola frondosa]|uniref:Bypass of stop codon protein 6 n=1 Tax=Grifola frondosa TaxID=5627 RepID=A0A1C7LX11_GRIFR|nr:Bypass of stop codon protein 6 [Grifola frondosa]